MKQILFTEPGRAALIEVAVPPVGPYDVKIKTAFSAISAGTERANIRGDKNVNIDENVLSPFPRASGYSSAGTVVEVGEHVTRVKVGDRVSMSWSKHAEYNVLPETQVFPLPDEVSFETAALFHIATFSIGAVRKTALEIGESACVMGIGILGLFAVMLLRQAGAVPVIAVDPSKSRRETALRFGADYALDPRDTNFAAEMKRLTNGGVKVAIEVTGIGDGLNGVLDCMAKFGRVALLGCTRDKSFFVDYYRRVHGPGVSLIGAHTLARPEKESSPHAFTLEDDVLSIMRLASVGRLPLGDTVGEVHSPQDAEEVYRRLLSDPEFPIVVTFDWSRL